MPMRCWSASATQRQSRLAGQAKRWPVPQKAERALPMRPMANQRGSKRKRDGGGAGVPPFQMILSQAFRRRGTVSLSLIGSPARHLSIKHASAQASESPRRRGDHAALGPMAWRSKRIKRSPLGCPPARLCALRGQPWLALQQPKTEKPPARMPAAFSSSTRDSLRD